MKLALIAHNWKKAEMVAFVLQNQAVLKDATLFATGTTGSHIERAGIDLEKLLSGPQGGDAQIAAMVAMGELDVVIFFRDQLQFFYQKWDGIKGRAEGFLQKKESKGKPL